MEVEMHRSLRQQVPTIVCFPLLGLFLLIWRDLGTIIGNTFFPLVIIVIPKLFSSNIYIKLFTTAKPFSSLFKTDRRYI